jgi:hypothetical protein
MPIELFTIGAEAWMLVAVAGLGIAALPWSAPEVAQVTLAAQTARKLMRVGLRWVRAPYGTVTTRALAAVVAR